MKKMVRTNYYYPTQMLTALRCVSEKTGLSVSELIRRAVAEMLEKNENKTNKVD